MSKAKIAGGILMILGTSIGAGMLALPVATAHESFLVSVGLLVGSWFCMTVAAFALLKVNLWLPEKANLISMAKATLGLPGQVVTWIVYLLLLYSLLSAYIAGSNDVVFSFLQMMHINLPQALSVIITTVLLGFIVYRGIYSVDIMNRGLMSGKLIILFILVVAMAPHIKVQHLLAGDYKFRLSALMIMMTSFGYAIIIPSLRGYYHGDAKRLKLVVLVGSMVPLLVYLLWVAAIQGVIPRVGNNGLLYIANSGHVVARLLASTQELLHNIWLSKLAKIFISICAITSFLGVSLCLTDFIADGMKLTRGSRHDIIIFLKAFLPPLLIVIFAPGIFMHALQYAGVLCVILLIILPIVMFVSGRFIRKIGV